jgi:hypothetical protein
VAALEDAALGSHKIGAKPSGDQETVPTPVEAIQLEVPGLTSSSFSVSSSRSGSPYVSRTHTPTPATVFSENITKIENISSSFQVQISDAELHDFIRAERHPGFVRFFTTYQEAQAMVRRYPNYLYGYRVYNMDAGYFLAKKRTEFPSDLRFEVAKADTCFSLDEGFTDVYFATSGMKIPEHL